MPQHPKIVARDNHEGCFPPRRIDDSIYFFWLLAPVAHTMKPVATEIRKTVGAFSFRKKGF
jgi:hypothetical protein